VPNLQMFSSREFQFVGFYTVISRNNSHISPRMKSGTNLPSTFRLFLISNLP
jgi:hypothetical protein